MLSKYVSDLMIKPGKSPVFEKPSKYGLVFEDVEFTTKDGLTLSGWLLKGGNKKVIIQSHFGVQCSRCGYTQEGKGLMKNALWNSDIHFLRHAQYLVKAGYSVLMYDLRNHGNSQQSSEPWITWGVNERLDVLAAVDFITNHHDYKKASIGLLSICMGAASSTFAFGMEKSLRDNAKVKTMVAVQPLTYDYFVKAMGMPKFIINSSNKYSKQRRGIDLTGDSFLPYVKDINVPTLVIQNKNDPMTDQDMVKQYFDSLTVDKQMLWLDIEKKRGAAYAWLAKNQEPILQWFSKYIN